jgi:hypothetical protein
MTGSAEETALKKPDEVGRVMMDLCSALLEMVESVMETVESLMMTAHLFAGEEGISYSFASGFHFAGYNDEEPWVSDQMNYAQYVIDSVIIDAFSAAFAFSSGLQSAGMTLHSNGVVQLSGQGVRSASSITEEEISTPSYAVLEGLYTASVIAQAVSIGTDLVGIASNSAAIVHEIRQENSATEPDYAVTPL